MLSKTKQITVFEHQSLILNESYNGICFNEDMLKSLQNHYGNDGVKYFSLINNGVKFCEYVGVLKVGNTVIEILPKADKNGHKDTWRNNLIGMLQAVGAFNVLAPTNCDLQLQANSILDLYFELFIRELEYLLHRGLVKRYRSTEGNCTALKGSLQFSKNIQKNLVHKERFYVKYSTYDTNHQLHHVLYKALKLLNRLNANVNLSSRLSSLILDFPEMKDIAVSEAFFSKISYDRKTEIYKPAIDIARLLLLNYHPSLSGGRDDVLALMFDMNMLWEQFVYVSLRKSGRFISVEAQCSKPFWKSYNGRRASYMKPDIVVDKGTNNCIVLDTKWKNLNGSTPSSSDLRQMYAYMMYFKARKVALVYPAAADNNLLGEYIIDDENESSIIELAVVDDGIEKWQASIVDYISCWIHGMRQYK